MTGRPGNAARSTGVLRGCDRGQSTVEFALLVPLVVAVLLALIQIGVIVYAQVSVTHVAREVARVLAVDPDADVGQVASKVATLGENRLEIIAKFETAQSGDRGAVLVVVTYEIPSIFGIFDWLLGDLEIHASAKMMAET